MIVMIKKAEYEQYKMENKAEYDKFMKHNQCLETNTTSTKAYAQLWENCFSNIDSKCIYS